MLYCLVDVPERFQPSSHQNCRAEGENLHQEEALAGPVGRPFFGAQILFSETATEFAWCDVLPASQVMELKMSSLRKWATPLTVGTFLIMGVTGALMFFHVDSGLNKAIHEWAGWLMLVGVGAHLVLNWRAFKTYFKRPLAMGIMGAGTLALLISFVPVDTGGGNPAFLVVDAMDSASVETVAELSGQTVDQAIATLAAAGFTATPDSRIAELTGGDKGKKMNMIKLLFDKASAL